MSKTERLDAYLAENDLEAAWFAQPNNFAWLLDADNVVARGGPGVAAAGYDGDSVTVVTSNIEANRFREEETPDREVVEFTWYEGSLAEAVAEESPEPAAADFDVPGFGTIDASPLRQPLTEGDIERYRALAAEVAAAMEETARGLSATDTEVEAAARLRGACAERDVDSPVALVGGGERAPRYRHYTPQDVEVGDYALLSVTAERGGLHTSTTRTVAFDPPEWLEERTEAAMRVEATALAATRAAGAEGGTAADVFGAIQDAYAEQGWEGEWRHHHQGGAAGYAGREWKATPTLDTAVELPMAFAWNPTVQGAKSEDTVLATEDGLEVLSATGDWETREVEAVGYDASVERHEILYR